MRFNKFDLNLLVALDVLLSEKSITKASHQLNLSQSATSGVLARLRTHFKDELLVQVGRTMVPTPMALSLAGPVRDVLLQFHATIDTKVEFVPSESIRHFRLIASDYPTTVILAEAGRILSQEAPGVTFEITSPGPQSLEELRRSEVDLMIVPKKYTYEGYPSEVLFEEGYYCAVWSSNSEVRDTLTLDQYMEMGHVSTNFGNRELPSFEEWFLKSLGMQRRVEVSTSNFSTVPQLLIGTNRIATMHKRLAVQFARYYPLRLLPVPLDIPVLEVAMQWHQHADHDPAHIWFRSLLRDIAKTKHIEVEGY